MLPLRCLPLWGREGVTLIIVKKIQTTNEDFYRQKYMIPGFSRRLADEILCYHPAQPVALRKVSRGFPLDLFLRGFLKIPAPALDN
jgi:hypothetical protein